MKFSEVTNMGATVAATATATPEPSDRLADSDPIELTGKIMVVAIIFLFVVVMFVLMLHLYAKWFWWRFEERIPPQQRNRRRRRRFQFAPGQDPIIYGSGTHQIGLEASILKSLPVLVFKPEDFKDGLECAVCLCDVDEGEKARILPKCNHGFHLDCIDMWFQSHSTCPLCRNLVSNESSKPNSTSNAEEINVLVSSEDENLSNMNGLESSNFPTNVLVFGNCQTQTQTQVSPFGVSLEEGNSQQQPCSTSSSSSSSLASVNNTMLVIDIPLPSEFGSFSLSSYDSWCVEVEVEVENEMKSPMSTRLRSFKRLLSRDKKLSPCSPGSMDVEQGHS
ncbi:RING-H2 finger protein ATL60-like [Vicia villosa]|uniref:RING-H2 finger protein ATL60-like n=1 Tax=Vicia villosa TaxID=3911 RepID=UPI00273CE1A0|nr:RING-H2 finger protein ATL60-like [Vicia villosa]